MKNFTLLFAAILALNIANAQYCMTGGPTSTGDSDLGAITLNGQTSNISIPASCPGFIGVENLTASQSADLVASNSYTLTIDFNTCGGSFNNAGEVWIDYNINNTFDANESIGTWSGTAPSGNQTYNFTVPTTVCNGPTRIRFMQQEGGSNPLNPCLSYSWGAIIDAEIVLSGGTCVITGCTDSLAFNYDPLATVDDGSCQYPTVQDCEGATIICQDYYEPDYFSGDGNVPDEVPASSCLGTGEKNAVWYQFTSYENGVLGFTIFPNDPTDDYDWAVYEITYGGCAGVPTGASQELSCDYAPNVCPPPNGDGSTGPNGDLSGPCAGQNQPLIPVDSGSTYVIVVSQYTDASQDGFTIAFDTNGVISANTIDAQDQQVNCGEQVILDAGFDGPILDTLLYTWTPASHLNDSTLENPETIKMDSTLDFFVQVQNGDCILEDTLTVEVTYADFTTLYDTTLCFGVDYKISPEYKEGINRDSLTFVWSPDIRINNVSDSAPTITSHDTITYFVEIRNGICLEYDSVHIYSMDSLDAGAEYYINNNFDIEGVAEVEFYNSSVGSFLNYNWDYDDGDTSILNEEFHIYEDEGTYIVSLLITDTLGCMDSIELEVKIPLLEIPNIITPNSDGINDVLSIKRLRPLSNLKVFNRWGKLVYDGLDYQNDWDGGDLQDGTYYIELSYQSGSELKTYKSWFVISR